MDERVVAAVEAAFPETSRQTVIELLELYGVEPYERERARVQLAIVALSGGSEEELLNLIQAAKVDYRDVLLWHDQGPMTEAEGRKAQEAVREMLRRWGKDL
jgi:hypothetical protein